MKEIAIYVLPIITFSVGLVLFLDELWMFIPGLTHPGWYIGDWTAYHIEPFHHWMLGIVLMGGSGIYIWRVWT
jgi:hypothetical protein